MVASNRRAFCQSLLGGAAVMLVGCRSQTAPTPDQGAPLLPAVDLPQQMQLESVGVGRNEVVSVRWARAIDAHGVVDAAAVTQMLDAALIRLTGSANPYAQWAGVKRRISVKVNTIRSQAFTHPALPAALARGLVAAGCDPSRVTVWDRDTFGLEDRGYQLDMTGKQGFVCRGGDAAIATTPKSALIAGAKIYLSPLLFESDLLFSIAALKDHSMAGVTLSLKNNFGMINGAQLLHGVVKRGSACEPGISELAALSDVRGRLQLAMIDALVGVCDGGPGQADPAHAFRYGGILLSRDPAALDRQGLAIIEARRKALGLLPLAQRNDPNPSPPIHIDNASALGV
jgi:uncharacterized protein (DUF362 family)